MKRKLYSSVLMGIMMLIGQAAWADLQQNESGAYLIGSKDDLQAWTETAGYEGTDVVLTGDIEGLDFMLCTNSTSYSGTFDGGGHTITLNYDFEGKQTGMFYNFAGTVKNLVVGGNNKGELQNSPKITNHKNHTLRFLRGLFSFGSTHSHAPYSSRIAWMTAAFIL